jgi:hypothetical protein
VSPGRVGSLSFPGKQKARFRAHDLRALCASAETLLLLLLLLLCAFVASCEKTLPWRVSR